MLTYEVLVVSEGVETVVEVDCPTGEDNVEQYIYDALSGDFPAGYTVDSLRLIGGI